MVAVRRSRAVWTGDLQSGSGVVSAESSRAYTDLAVTWAARTESPNGKTSPEELLGSAHASCFCMQLSGALAKAGTPPLKLEVTAQVTFAQDPEGGGFKVASSDLEVKGWISGIDEETFRAAAEAAKDGCPISKSLEGNVKLSVVAQLQR